ncbi:unnamed protein product [Peniophora sp. CBMAI 1063]|nr:unnamed protein product [Peniophora sp. CBMAI 1063]
MDGSTQLLYNFVGLLGSATGALVDLARTFQTPSQPPNNPFLSLPYDVHCELLSWLAALDPPSFSRDQLRGYRVKHLGWIALAQTCRSLRLVALEQPQLWARVVLVPTSEQARSIFLERSGEAGLTFRFNGNLRHPSEHGWLIQRPGFSQIIGNSSDLDFCARHLHQAAELSISVPVQWLSNLTGARLPLLHTLHLCASDAAFTDVPHMPSEWLEAPNLIGAAFCDTKLPLYAPKLRFVALQNCNWVQQPDTIPPSAIFGQLRAAPLLEEVKLHNVLTRNDYPLVMDEGSPIELPFLKRFCFRGSLSGLESLMAILRIPSNVSLDIEFCGDFLTPPVETCPLSTLVRRLGTNFHKHADPTMRFFELSVYDGVPGELPYAWPGMSQTPWTRINPARMEIDRSQVLNMCIPRLSAAGVSVHPSEPVYAPELRAALYMGVFTPFNGSQLRMLALRHIIPKLPLERVLHLLRSSPCLSELYLDEAFSATAEELMLGDADDVALPSLAYVVYRGAFSTFKALWTRLDVPATMSLHLVFLGEQIASSPEDRQFLGTLCAQDTRSTTLRLSYLDLDWSLHGYFVHCASRRVSGTAKRYTTFTEQHVSPGVHLCLNQLRSKGEHSYMYHNSQTVMDTLLSTIDCDKVVAVEFDFASLAHLRGEIKTVLEGSLRRLLHVRRIAICHSAPLGQLYNILATTGAASLGTRATHCFPQLDSIMERQPTQDDRVWMDEHRRLHGYPQTQWAALQGMVRDRLWFNKPIRYVEVLKPLNFLSCGEDPDVAATSFEDNLAYTLTLGCDVLVGELS